MILTFAPAANLGPAPLVLALAALLGYALAAWPAAMSAAMSARWPSRALLLAWVLHGVLLALDVGGWGRVEPGARLGFGPVLSLTAWLVLAVHSVESRWVPLPAVRQALAAAGALGVLLAWGFPGELRPAANAWEPVHWALGVAAYALFGAATLHAWMLGAAERSLRTRGTTLVTAAAADVRPARSSMGLPLLRLERLTFRFVEAGFVVLTGALALGVLTAAQWRWNHKSVFSLLGWAVFAVLLWGRHRRGWRGAYAVRWLYAGAALLLLAYAGSRFVFEVVLGRSAT